MTTQELYKPTTVIKISQDFLAEAEEIMGDDITQEVASFDENGEPTTIIETSRVPAALFDDNGDEVDGDAYFIVDFTAEQARQLVHKCGGERVLVISHPYSADEEKEYPEFQNEEWMGSQCAQIAWVSVQCQYAAMLAAHKEFGIWAFGISAVADDDEVFSERWGRWVKGDLPVASGNDFSDYIDYPDSLDKLPEYSDEDGGSYPRQEAIAAFYASFEEANLNCDLWEACYNGFNEVKDSCEPWELAVITATFTAARVAPDEYAAKFEKIAEDLAYEVKSRFCEKLHDGTKPSSIEAFLS